MPRLALNTSKRRSADAEPSKRHPLQIAIKKETKGEKVHSAVTCLKLPDFSVLFINKRNSKPE